MLSPERIDLLQRQWVRLLGEFDVAPGAAYPVFDQLVAAYAEPHRHYHTLEHVAETLRVAARLPSADPKAVAVAVWFHDAVYDPKATDNEARSASLVVDWLGPLGVPENVTGRVAGLVLATAHFAEGRSVDADTAALLDADLAVLGASESRYRRYAADVRREYAHVPDDAFRRGRAAVLGAFLSRSRIYLTEAMYLEGEGMARRSILAELAKLRSDGDGPA